MAKVLPPGCSDIRYLQRLAARDVSVRPNEFHIEYAVGALSLDSGTVN